ncbi:hypothetical protein P8452_39890 [Trifolium repens]|nr:hypothetical protein P8452_39890 [Trifolium repens]
MVNSKSKNTTLICSNSTFFFNIQHTPTHTLRSQISHLISVANSKFTLFRFDPKPRSFISNLLLFSSLRFLLRLLLRNLLPRIASRRQCRHS